MTAEEARIDLNGLALILGYSYDWTVRHWRELVRDKGLPEPFVGGRQPRWSRKLVEAWRDGALPAPAAAPEISAPAQPAAALPVANDPAPVRRNGAKALLKAAAR